MFRVRMLAIAMIGLALNLFFFQATARAGTKEDKLAQKVKSGIQKLGTGKDSVVKIKLKDKSKINGYISEIAERDFTVFDEASNAETKIPYDQVKQVKGNNLSKGMTVVVVVGFVLALGILFAVIWD